MSEDETVSRILRHKERMQRKEIDSIDAFFGDLNPRERADIVEQLSYREKKLLQAAMVKRCGNCRSIIRATYWRCIALQLYGGREVNPGWFGCRLHQWRKQ